MKIFKTREVKTPEVKGNGINFFIPYTHPGKTYLAPGQSERIPSGLHYRVPAGTALVSVSTISEVEDCPKLKVEFYHVVGDPNAEVVFHVTNIGDEVEVLKPGQYIARAIVTPIVEPKVEITEELDEFLSGPKKDPELDFNPDCGTCPHAHNHEPIQSKTCIDCMNNKNV